jgi:hypothetical protein
MAIKAHPLKFQRQWFGPYKIQYCLPNNKMLLMTIDKFDHNPILQLTLMGAITITCTIANVTLIWFFHVLKL